jgi:hypothetical protein
MLALALFVGGMTFSGLRGYWADFWIFQSPKQVTATVTAQQSHGVCEYQYVVNGIPYVGHGQRGRNLPQQAQVGTPVLVYFSASHPWLSSPDTPGFSPWQALTIMALLLVAELFLVKAVIRPSGDAGQPAGI